jgi:predicted permease
MFAQSVRAYISDLWTKIEIPKLEIVSASRGLNGLREEFSKALYLLFAMVGLVLLIACANVAGLMIARGTSRRREMAIRLSVGATKARVIGQVLTESILLALFGGAVALLVAGWLSVVLIRLLTNGRPAFHLVIDLDHRILIFTTGISLLCGLAFGLAPALAAIHVSPLTCLKQSGGPVLAGKNKFLAGNALVGTQIAISLVLLIGAGALVRTLQALERTNLGFERSGVLQFTVRPGVNGYDRLKLTSYYDELAQRIRAVPGVRSVSFAEKNPIGDGSTVTLVEIPGYTPSGKRVSAYRHVIAPDYFSTLHVPVILGRAIGSEDTYSSQPVVVVNHAFAKKYFHNDNPIGHELNFGRIVAPKPLQIVGVVGDVRYDRIRRDPPPTLYMPYTQIETGPPFMTYQLRVSGSMDVVAHAIGSTAISLDPDVPIVNVSTEDETVNRVLYLERTFALVSSSFATLALALACIGIFGTMAYSVALRTNEIGVRMAFGAERRRILTMILRDSFRIVAAGVIAGLPLAWIGVRALGAQLYGLSAHDLFTPLMAVTLISLIALWSAFVPALRASRIEPIDALRYEG